MEKQALRQLTLYQWAGYLVVIVYGLLIAFGSNSSFPLSLKTSSWMPHLYDKPVGEDGFYMLMVAWNLAEGKGLVGNFDQAVTGIQPLATFFYGAIASIVKFFNGDKDSFVRAIIAFGTLNTILFAYLMGRLTKKLTTGEDCARLASFFGTILACGSYYIFRISTYGLETGIYLVCFAILLLQYLKIREEYLITKFSISLNVILFGILVGITGLARIDFGIIFTILIGYNLFKNRALIFPLIVAGAIGTIIISPWLIYVYETTGTPIPSSGPAQASLISLSNLQGRTSAMYFAFVQNFMPIIYLGAKWYTLVIASFLLIPLILIGKKQRMFLKLGDLSDWVFPLLSLLPIYITFFWAAHFYSRYTAPLLLVGIPFVALSLARILKAPDKARYVKAIAVGSIMSFLGFSQLSFHRGTLGNSHSVTAGYIAKEMPNEIVGAFQSGVIGFVNSKVINLDGKVNFEVLPYIKQGNIDAYLQKNEQIKVVIDWPGYIEKFISPEYLKASWELCIDGSSWGSVGYCRKEP